MPPSTDRPLKENSQLLERAQRGDKEAQHSLGLAYAWGDDGWANDLSLTRYWYSLSAEQGQPDALCDLGQMFIDGEGGEINIDHGIKPLERAASQRRWSPSAEYAARLLVEWIAGDIKPASVTPAKIDFWNHLWREQRRKYRGWKRKHS